MLDVMDILMKYMDNVPDTVVRVQMYLHLITMY